MNTLWKSKTSNLIVRVMNITKTHVIWEADYFRGSQPTLKEIFYNSMAKQEVKI